jgi:hypothetical protein
MLKALPILDLQEIKLAELPLEKPRFFKELNLEFKVCIHHPFQLLLPFPVISHIFSDTLLLVFYSQEI